MQDVAIIGGGISGLATAWELRRRGVDAVVLERETHPGGKAVSERIGGFLMEHGPSTIAAGSAAVAEVSDLLGLSAERCELGPDVRNRYLVDGGALANISANPIRFLLSGYMPVLGCLRVLAEVAVPRARDGGDETIAAFFSRRFGPDVATRLVEPVVRGIYGGDVDKLSAAAVFPTLIELEQRHGSVIRGAVRRLLSGKKMAGGGLFTWRDGVASLPARLAAELGPAVRGGIAVRRIRRTAAGFAIDAGEAGELQARAVVIATPPYAAAELLDGLDEEAVEAVGAVAEPPLAVVFLGYRRELVEHPLDGLGFFAARGERRALNGAQFCSTMFEGRAPEGHVAVAGYFGGDAASGPGRATAGELVALARREFADLLGAKGEPVVGRVRHWPRGLPQYRLGHAERVATLRAAESRVPGLFLTGNYFGGPSVGACLDEAMKTAARVPAATAARTDGSEPILAASGY